MPTHTKRKELEKKEKRKRKEKKNTLKNSDTFNCVGFNSFPFLGSNGLWIRLFVDTHSHAHTQAKNYVKGFHENSISKK